MKRWMIYGLAGAGALLILGGFYVFSVKKYPVQNLTDAVRDVTGTNNDSDAIKAGKKLSNGKCRGSGLGKLVASPMRPEDFSIIIPYGLMVGGHVTPIDHQYFSPKDYQSQRDAYPVFAMADSNITEIQPRTTERGTEYRMVFTMTCTFLYYYDLVTSLSGEVKTAYEQNKNEQGYAGNLDLPVKAGQQIGAIGGQTLDFAVWDTEKPLKGFITPKLYEAEPWKVYTVDPLDYYADDLKALAIARNPRTAEPASGKIDYDVDGKLIGNWFVRGTGGYSGDPNKGYYSGSGYWKGHLSFAPDHWDPTVFIISIGSLVSDDGRGSSTFAARGNAPNPAGVSPASGLVKYELVQYSYIKPDGSAWSGMDVIKGPRLREHNNSQGCALAQMEGDRALKFEVFTGKSCAQAGGFTAAAQIYER